MSIELELLLSLFASIMRSVTAHPPPSDALHLAGATDLPSPVTLDLLSRLERPTVELDGQLEVVNLVSDDEDEPTHQHVTPESTLPPARSSWQAAYGEQSAVVLNFATGATIVQPDTASTSQPASPILSVLGPVEHEPGCPEHYEWRGTYCAALEPNTGPGWYMQCRRRVDPLPNTAQRRLERSAFGVAIGPIPVEDDESEPEPAAKRPRRASWQAARSVYTRVEGSCPDQHVCHQLNGLRPGESRLLGRWSPKSRQPMPRVTCVPAKRELVSEVQEAAPPTQRTLQSVARTRQEIATPDGHFILNLGSGVVSRYL